MSTAVMSDCEYIPMSVSTGSSGGWGGRAGGVGWGEFTDLWSQIYFRTIQSKIESLKVTVIC